MTKLTNDLLKQLPVNIWPMLKSAKIIGCYNSLNRDSSSVGF